MILAGHQPNYLPNLAYFAKMQQADLFVVTSNLQFVRDKEWHRRNRVAGLHGTIWMTVPVLGGYQQIFRDVRVRDDLPWRRRQQETLRSLYGQTFGAEFLPLFLEVYQQKWERLVDLNFALIKLMASILEIDTQIILDEEVTGRKEDLITNVCQKYAADKYLSGAGGRLYMDEAYWQTLGQQGIEPVFVRGDLSRFYPCSALHYLLAYGREWTQRVVRGQARMSGYQPQYFPRLHYLARMLNSDIFTISDNVQFVKSHQYPQPDGVTMRQGKSYQADTLIKLSRGVHHLTVPIKHAGEKFKAITRTQIAYDRAWAENHLQTLAVSYGRAKNFPRLWPQLQAILTRPYQSLAELNTVTLMWALRWILGEGRRFAEPVTLAQVNNLLAKDHPFRLRHIVRKSEVDELAPPTAGDATDAIIERCQRLGVGEYYLGGTAHQTYIDDRRFARAGVRLVEQEWECRPYGQLFPKVNFAPNLSILDLLFNEDSDNVKRVLLGEKVADRVRV